MADIRVIDEDARRRFEQLWAEGNPHPIEEFLPDETRQSYLPTLEELVLIDLEFSWRTWSSLRSGSGEVHGETVVGPPHAETYVSRFAALQRPEFVRRLVLEEISLRNRYGPPPSIDEYRERFPDVELPDTLCGRKDGLADDTHPGQEGEAGIPALDEKLPRQFGPYLLTERIGAGGMGVVYGAWQRGVEREIAVKILRTDRLADLPAGDRQVMIDRFRNEVRATARIDHPQIVNVFDVGELDGVPYYTMQYVNGASLGDTPEAEPLPEREAARIIQVVAGAVQAAHDHGILHRDLKPQNIIVEESSGAPFVADFGLAKLLEENSSQTMTGEILGTPQYMPPEQARDSGQVTTRSDVYSLGATLYFLLTGQSPFPGRNHLEILRQVLDKNATPPRQLNAGIDADLEVICLKCLEKEPDQRYASARALADDLSCWLQGEPIAARPPGRWEHVRRWCRRNPLASTLVAATSASLVFGVVALWTGYASAMTGWSEAERQYEGAHQKVNEFFTIVSEDVLLNQPGMQPLRKALLERARAHYEEFLRDRQDDPELRAEVAATHYRVGRITEVLESLTQALTSYERAVALQRSLHDEQPDSEEVTEDLSTTLNAMGACLTRLGRADEALGAFREAERLRSLLFEVDEDNVEYQRLLANTVMNIGLVYKSQLQFDEARMQIEASISARTEALSRSREPPKVVRDQGMAFFNLANLELDLNQLNSAAENLDRAIEHLGRFAQQMPEDLVVRQRIALCFRVLGELRFRQQDYVRAEDSYSRALELMRELASENPRVEQYQVELARLLIMSAELPVEQAEWERAIELLTECHERMAVIVDQNGGAAAARAELAKALQGLAGVHREREEWPEALEKAEQARSHLQQLTAEFPDEAFWRQLEATQLLIDEAGARSGL